MSTNDVETLRTLTQGLRPTGLHWTSEDDEFGYGKLKMHDNKPGLPKNNQQQNKTDRSESQSDDPPTALEHFLDPNERFLDPKELAKLLQEREDLCQKRSALQIKELQQEHVKMLDLLHNEVEKLQQQVFDLTYQMKIKTDKETSEKPEDTINLSNHVIKIDSTIEEMAKLREKCKLKEEKIVQLDQQLSDLRILQDNQHSELLQIKKQLTESVKTALPVVTTTAMTSSTAKNVSVVKKKATNISSKPSLPPPNGPGKAPTGRLTQPPHQIPQQKSGSGSSGPTSGTISGSSSSRSSFHGTSKDGKSTKPLANNRLTRSQTSEMKPSTVPLAHTSAPASTKPAAGIKHSAPAGIKQHPPPATTRGPIPSAKSTNEKNQHAKSASDKNPLTKSTNEKSQQQNLK